MLLRHLETGTAWELNRSPQLAGTRTDADIVLPCESCGSTHAAFVMETDGWTAYDLGGTRAGMRIRGRRVRRHVLAAGETLDLGDVSFMVEEGSGSSSSSDGDSAFDFSVLDYIGDRDSDRIESNRCHIDFFQGRRHLMSARLERSVMVGSAHHCDLRIQAPDFPRQAGLLIRDAGVWYWIEIPPKGSSGGLKSVPLKTGDELRIGDVLGLVWLGPSHDSAERTVAIASRELPTPDSSIRVLPKPPTAEEADAQEEAAAEEPSAEFAEATRLGGLELRIGSPRKAVAFFRTACRLSPFSLPGRKRLRQAQRRCHPGGGRGFSKSLAPRIFWHQVRTLQAGIGSDARPVLDRAEQGLSLDPWNVGLSVFQARAFARQGLWSHSLWALGNARLRDPNNVPVNRLLAKVLLARGDFDRSVHFWKKVLRQQPNDRQAAEGIRDAQVRKTLSGGLVADSDALDSSDFE